VARDGCRGAEGAAKTPKRNQPGANISATDMR
jgi:hypothetical protein